MNELSDLIRRFVLSLRLRAAPMLAVLAQNKGATSIGAIAGLAIALVCTWRYISQARGRRRAGKRDGAPRRPGSGSGHDSDLASASGVSRTITHASKRGGDKHGLRESSPPVQYTLSQYVRRQLNGARKMTVYMPGIVLIESTPEELQLEPDWHVDSSSETISQLARFVKKELHITPTGAEVVGGNIVSAVSLESFFRPPSV
ncbi:hypothetical protein CBR_g22069 [Chara braunii]|uniref:Uncharacterized protein n=1 Tax=Chara braunii TaxID=69332 RepID=A0A388L265_CHABU|nr:hypothetical protein CBR_g22069 [Chara braunii]|eukprot:GBG76322.1 hypothetical protein CBR_g22069 [Chara braunii]